MADNIGGGKEARGDSMRVELSKLAKKQLFAMNEPLHGRIQKALKDLELEPPKGDVKPLTGRKGYTRVRVGDYRILFRADAGIIWVHTIEPRGQVYKGGN
ncbi:MAG: type II toxin-antitoxin system RelE/ParE family toxin [Oscillospiraceae bacterium]|jgi:mRNA interferase RelE/StbE|nr:type II toxin-antitoxin system RelE/ParE family toxin [Oscillospiraceae bacterium]